MQKRRELSPRHPTTQARGHAQADGARSIALHANSAHRRRFHDGDGSAAPTDESSANPVRVEYPVRTMAGPSPLLGYNTNVRHKGKLYHIQTEDSGVKHPHVMTHLFADGGRIIASRKTAYADLVGREDLRERVKELMRAQHKAMFIALRDGEFDEDNAHPTQELKQPPVDVDALEAAAARLAAAPVPPPPQPLSTPPKASARYQSTRPASAHAPAAARRPPSSSPGSIFGSDLLSEKSLDEVILSYLAEDLDDEG